MRLRDVRVFRVTANLVRDTEAALREAGREDNEVFLFWSGAVDADAFHARALHRPAQTCYRSPHGLSVRIGAEALATQARWLAEHGELLGVQIHGHPEDAYHSEADDAHAVVTLTGALSIVVPSLGAGPLLGSTTQIYRLGVGGWQRLERPSAGALVQVVP